MQSVRPKPPSDREPLAGLVERVTFHNADNGFCVLRIKARGHRDLVTLLGVAPSISAGEYIQASGNWENNREHGVQFQAGLIRRSFARSWHSCKAMEWAPRGRCASSRPTAPMRSRWSRKTPTG